MGGSVFPHCWLFGLNAPALEPEGCQCGQFLTSKWWPLWELRSMNNPWGMCHQFPCLHSEPQLTLVSPGDPLRPTGKSGSSFYGVTTFPWVPVHWNLVCTLQEWSLCFPQSYRAPSFWPCWPSKPNTLGAFPPLYAGHLGLGAWQGSKLSLIGLPLWLSW